MVRQDHDLLAHGNSLQSWKPEAVTRHPRWVIEDEDRAWLGEHEGVGGAGGGRWLLVPGCWYRLVRKGGAAWSTKPLWEGAAFGRLAAWRLVTDSGSG
jgi:hypothetical protein